MTSDHGTSACDDCLRRTWLLGRLTGHLDLRINEIDQVLAVPDVVLITEIGGRRQDTIMNEYEGIGSTGLGDMRRDAGAVGLATICACDPAYPRRLGDLVAPPAVLHVAGGMDRFLDLCGQDSVAIVGSRRAGAYGLEVASQLARGAGSAGLTVVSGMASGIDSAAHLGALAASGGTIAALPGSAHLPVPARNRRLHAQIITGGVAVSELGPGTAVRNWSYLARNRIIAALGHVAVVVQAGVSSGSLKTIDFARALGRPIAAVPGAVNNQMSEGPNALLAQRRATLIRGAQDLLDLVAQAGGGTRWIAPIETRAALTPQQDLVLEAISHGHDTIDALMSRGETPGESLAELSAMELSGWIRRGPGGRYSIIR